jgi:hypothetical protein
MSVIIFFSLTASSGSYETIAISVKFKNSQNFMRFKAEVRLTQAELIDGVSQGIDLEVLERIIAGNANLLRNVAAHGERLVHSAAINLT